MSGKYSDVCPDTVARLSAQAAARFRSPKEADKAVKGALHQITGAFMTPDELKRARKLLAQRAQTVLGQRGGEESGGGAGLDGVVRVGGGPGVQVGQAGIAALGI